ncbi:MAG: hypothetical protein ACYSW8_33320 [Planctomycetota bacterium]|jgi:hypothetical protein
MPQDLQNKPKPEGETTKLIKGALIMLEKQRARGFIIVMDNYHPAIRYTMDKAIQICREQGKGYLFDVSNRSIRIEGIEGGELIFRSASGVACCPHALEGIKYPILIDHGARLTRRTWDWISHRNAMLGWEGM